MSDNQLLAMGPERDAVIDAVNDSRLSVLTYFASEPVVAVVNRDVSTEHPQQGEPIVLIEWRDDDHSAWHHNHDWAITHVRGKSAGQWDHPGHTHIPAENRQEAIELAKDVLSATDTAECLNEYGNIPEKRALAVSLVDIGFTHTEVAALLEMDNRGGVSTHVTRYRTEYEAAEWLTENAPSI